MRSFWAVVQDRLEDGELDLDDLPEGCPLELCNYLGALRDEGGMLDCDKGEGGRAG